VRRKKLPASVQTELERLIAEEIDKTAPPRPDDLTVERVMMHNGMSYATAARVLRRLAATGLVERRYAIQNGKRITVYREKPKARRRA
jgi:DNA-binding MarR family transcriptional regulator